MASYDLGFLGNGQLARMSIGAAQRMGLRGLSLGPGEDSPAGQLADSLVADLADVDALASLFSQCERVTLENEFVPAEAIRAALARAGREPSAIVPDPDCLERIQDKLRQHEAYAAAGVACAPFASLSEPLGGVAERLGFPIVVKRRMLGYDGKGTVRVESMAALEGTDGAPHYAEALVEFERELAVMVCRPTEGEPVCFPTVETVQIDHRCDLVFPAEADAQRLALQAVEALGGFGLFGVELFELPDGTMLVNEVAPRPHNTGHYTLDWGGLSQFEAHVRLVLGLPLPTPHGHATCMANLIGRDGAGDWRIAARALFRAEPDARLHWYGKSAVVQGRKMGHVNVAGSDCVRRAVAARQAFYEAW